MEIECGRPQTLIRSFMEAPNTTPPAPLAGSIKLREAESPGEKPMGLLSTSLSRSLKKSPVSALAGAVTTFFGVGTVGAGFGAGIGLAFGGAGFDGTGLVGTGAGFGFGTVGFAALGAGAVSFFGEGTGLAGVGFLTVFVAGAGMVSLLVFVDWASAEEATENPSNRTRSASRWNP